MNESRFVQYSLRTFLVQVVVTTLTVATTILSARFLGPGGKGVLSLLVLIPILGVTFGRLGLGNAVIYYAPKTSRPQLVLNGLLLSCGLGAAVSILVLPVVFGLKNSVFRTIPASWLIIMCGAVFFFFIYDFVVSILVALYRIGSRNFLVLSFSLGNLLLFVILVIGLGGKTKGALGAWCLALLVSAGLGLVLLVGTIVRAKPKIDKALMKDLLRFGLKSHFGTTMEFLNYRADFFLVNLFANPASVGLYSAAVNMAEIGWKLPEAVTVVFMPNVVRMSSARAGEFVPRICRVLLVSVTAFSLLVAVFRKPLILLFFGRPFLPSERALLILLPGFMAFVVWKILSYSLMAQGHPLKYSWTAALAFLTMVVLDLGLIPRMGIEGAALASTVTYVLATMAAVVIYRRLTPCSLRELLIPRKSDWVVLADYARDLRLSWKRSGGKS